MERSQSGGRQGAEAGWNPQTQPWQQLITHLPWPARLRHAQPPPSPAPRPAGDGGRCQLHALGSGSKQYRPAMQRMHAPLPRNTICQVHLRLAPAMSSRGAPRPQRFFLSPRNPSLLGRPPIPRAPADRPSGSASAGAPLGPLCRRAGGRARCVSTRGSWRLMTDLLNTYYLNCCSCWRPPAGTILPLGGPSNGERNCRAAAFSLSCRPLLARCALASCPAAKRSCTTYSAPSRLSHSCKANPQELLAAFVHASFDRHADPLAG